MNTHENTLQRLLERDYPLVVRRSPAGYAAFVPSLGIVVSAVTLDECHVMVEERKKALFEALVEGGFDDALLSGPAQFVWQRTGARMLFTILVLFLLLLTILIPANYLLSKIEHLVPVYAEAAMDVVQRRVQQMSDDDQRKLSGLATRMCPVIDDMVEARCRQLAPAGATGSTKAGRR